MTEPPTTSDAQLVASRHWKAVCVERRTHRLGRGGWKRVSNDTSPAAYFTRWGPTEKARASGTSPAAYPTREGDARKGPQGTSPASYLGRAGPGHGADERARCQLLPVQCHVLLERSLVRRPGTHTRRRAIPQGRQRLPGRRRCTGAPSGCRSLERGAPAAAL